MGKEKGQLLNPQTDAEKQFAEQLGREGGIRPEFARQILDARTETHDAAQGVMAEVESDPTAKPEPPANMKPQTKPQSPLVILSKCPHSPEHKKYIETIVGTAIPSVRKSFQNAGRAIPTDDEILQQMVMTERFKPDQVDGLIRTVRTPGLMVLPPEMRSFEDYERFLNANKKRRGQRDVSVTDGRRTAFAAQDEALRNATQASPASYKFRIGEIDPEPDNRSGKLREIIRGISLPKGLRVMTPREHAVSQGQAQDLIDLNGWSILCEENEPHKIIGDDNLVSGGRGYDRPGDAGVDFYDHNPGNVCSYARVRPVSGD